MSDVTIFAPSAVASAGDLPVTPEDENKMLRATIMRLEREAMTRDVAIETIGTLLACAISQMLDDCDFPVEEIVWEREMVRKMQERNPHVEVRETIGGDTAARLTFRGSVSIGVGE